MNKDSIYFVSMYQIFLNVVMMIIFGFYEEKYIWKCRNKTIFRSNGYETFKILPYFSIQGKLLEISFLEHPLCMYIILHYALQWYTWVLWVSRIQLSSTGLNAVISVIAKQTSVL